MKKSDQKKLMNQLILILTILGGFVGSNVLMAKFKEYLPANFQKFTNIGGLAASIYGAAMAKGWLKDVSVGAAAFSGLSLMNQFIPDGSSIKAFVPQLSGIGVTSTSLGDIVPETLRLPQASYSEYNDLQLDDTFAGINGGSVPTEEYFV